MIYIILFARNKIKAIQVLLFLCLKATLVFVILIALFFAPIFGSKTEKIFIIKQGSTAKSIAFLLAEKEVFPFPYIFLASAIFLGYSNNIHSGYYSVKKKTSLWELLQLLQKGSSKDIEVQILPGLTAKQIFAVLKKSDIKNNGEYENYFTDKDFIKEQKLPKEVKNLEGFLFPDTYKFATHTKEEKVLEKIISNFHQKTKNLKNNSKYSSYELLILASIVEKESSIEAEKKLIASVFFNRLTQNIRLQTDPTVIYGIPNFNGNITKKNLRTYTPYNTYKIQGLPPTPISNPSISTMKSVYNPSQTKYLYFVGKGDGSSYFSTNLRDHNNAVNRYQRRKNKNYKSF